jgi:hypothetical protein
MNILTIGQLQAGLEGARGDLLKLETLSSERIDLTRALATRKADLSEDRFAKDLAGIAENTARRGAAVIPGALQRIDTLLQQEPYWSRDSMIRRSRLTPPPKGFSAADGTIVLDSAQAVLRAASEQAGQIAEIAESCAKLWKLEQLRALNYNGFLSELETAVQEGDLATLGIASLAVVGRDDAERLSGEVRKAIAGLDLPDQAQASGVFFELKSIRQQIASLQQILAEAPTVDLRSWVFAELRRLEEQETRDRLRASAS